MNPRFLFACALTVLPPSQTLESLSPDELEAVVTTGLGTFRFEFAYR
jgi:hypothetical protein